MNMAFSFGVKLPMFQEPADAATDEMLRLQLDNLKLRFDSIDPNDLQSEHENNGTIGLLKRSLGIGPMLLLKAITLPN
jgi:hypothetical protein